MAGKALNGSVDLLAKAIRQVFDEEVREHPAAEQDEGGLPETQALDQQGREPLDRI